MRKAQGNYMFHFHRFRKPVEFCIWMDQNTFVELQSREYFLEFVLTTDVQQDDLWHLISIGADGLGFLLDIPTSSARLSTFEDGTQYPPERHRDEKIDFELIERTMKKAPSSGYFADIEIPKSISYLCSEIEDFIIKLRSSELLRDVVGHYMKSIEEPELFLVSLYKAYELLKDTGAVSKTAADRFTRLANNPRVYISRHANKDAPKFRPPSPDDWQYSQEFIRKGIFEFAKIL